MKMLAIAVSLAILTISALPAGAAPATPRFAVAQGPTPVLNTPAFHDYFRPGRRLDPCQGVRPIETVALPGTLFRIEGVLQDKGATIYRVTTRDYPYPKKTGYFVDARFVKPVPPGTPERVPQLPSLDQVQKGLLAALGKPYVWGGNVREGVPLLAELYPGGETLGGVDCSGLLYQATDGYTARNTLALINYGTAVPVAGLTAEQVAQQLEPLDLIVWDGHVMVVLDGESIIQSRMGCQGGGGVVMSPLGQTLRNLMKTRKPRDIFPQGSAGQHSFVVRRWFPR
jgi:hypothetical protein